MPTARELLEEVDALMRRNRGGEAGPVEHGAPATEPPGAGSGSVHPLPDVAPVTDASDAARATESDAGDVTEVAAGAESPAADDDDIPVLTEIAGADGGAAPFDVEADAPLPVDALPDDFPVLTDAIEDSAAAGMFGIAANASGEAASGEAAVAITEPDETVIEELTVEDAQAFPSTATSPSAFEELRAPDERPGAEAIDMRSSGEGPVVHADGTRESFEFDPAALDAALVAARAGADVAAEDVSTRGTADAADEASLASVAEVADRDGKAPDLQAAEAELSDWLRDHTAGPAAAADAVVSLDVAATAAQAASASTSPGGQRETAAVPREQAPLASDDPRWASLAEEIRVQVLQRVDLFTEAGLQSQLQQHLQPIVDRASAELVATINRQVGQLLRAYVAEAIEREIEKWRNDAR